MALLINGSCFICGKITLYSYYDSYMPNCTDCVNEEKRAKRMLEAKNKRLSIVRRSHSCRVV